MTSSETPKPKRGRRRRHAGEVLPTALSFRLRSALHERIKLGAEQGDRSLSEEIERTLESAYEREDRLGSWNNRAHLATLEIVLIAVDKILQQGGVPDADETAPAQAHVIRRATRRGAIMMAAEYMLKRHENLPMPLLTGFEEVIRNCEAMGRKIADDALPKVPDEEDAAGRLREIMRAAVEIKTEVEV